MLFKDRADAGLRLAGVLTNSFEIKKNLRDIIVVSILRGGIIVGAVIAKKLNCYNLPLVVSKIPSPDNPELAIGALCFNIVYLEKEIINSLVLNQLIINSQIRETKEKFKSYLKRFHLNENSFNNLRNKAVILVDDGAATGSTIKTALLFLKDKRIKKIFLALPVAPLDFNVAGVAKLFILKKSVLFSSVSQFYRSFTQVDNEQVLQYV